MLSPDILAAREIVHFLDLKIVCQLITCCRFCRDLYASHLYSTGCIHHWIDTAESWEFLDDRSLVALAQISVTIRDILHIAVRSRQSDFDLLHVELDSSSDSSSSLYYGREVFSTIRRFSR